jgi:hypothetical protein
VKEGKYYVHEVTCLFELYPFTSEAHDWTVRNSGQCSDYGLRLDVDRSRYRKSGLKGAELALESLCLSMSRLAQKTLLRRSRRLK